MPFSLMVTQVTQSYETDKQTRITSPFFSFFFQPHDLLHSSLEIDNFLLLLFFPRLKSDNNSLNATKKYTYMWADVNGRVGKKLHELRTVHSKSILISIRSHGKVFDSGQSGHRGALNLHLIFKTSECGNKNELSWMIKSSSSEKRKNKFSKR